MVLEFLFGLCYLVAVSSLAAVSVISEASVALLLLASVVSSDSSEFTSLFLSVFWAEFSPELSSVFSLVVSGAGVLSAGVVLSEGTSSEVVLSEGSACSCSGISP